VTNKICRQSQGLERRLVVASMDNNFNNYNTIPPLSNPLC
jgi:hypothetical protein